MPIPVSPRHDRDSLQGSHDVALRTLPSTGPPASGVRWGVTRVVPRSSCSGGEFVPGTEHRQLRDKAILVPIETFRNAVPGAMQVPPSEALKAWANTPHCQDLATVLRGIAAEITAYANAVEQLDRQRRS